MGTESRWGGVRDGGCVGMGMGVVCWVAKYCILPPAGRIYPWLGNNHLVRPNLRGHWQIKIS